MKIGLDLRFLKAQDPYSTFVAILVQKLIETDKEHLYTVYLNSHTKSHFWHSVNIEKINEKPWSLKEQITFFQKLKKDDNYAMIFFTHKKPLFYKWNFVLFVPELKELHYQSKRNFLEKFIDDIFLEKALEKARKVICFEQQTKIELNEKLNISENKVEILHPFFTLKKKKLEEWQNIVDVKIKNNIKWEFFVYSCWNWNNKNLDRIIDVFAKLKKQKVEINLVVLDQNLTEDINYRKKVIEESLQDRIIFMWDVKEIDRIHFYEQSIWSLCPTLYESFPFCLTESVSQEVPILASSIKQIKEIMWSHIDYFSPVSSIDMVEAIKEFINFWRKKVDYTELQEKYSPENSTTELIKIIKSI